MGHDTHFLRRLARADASQTNMALSVYRDPELVRHILSHLRLADGSSHVALALADSPDACHIVVARDGRFVTCLGAGMKPHADQPIVARARVDAIAAKVEDLRARTALAKEMAGSSETDRLLKRLSTAGHRLSREEFVAISACQPVLATTFLVWMLDVSKGLDEARTGILRVRRFRARDEPHLRTYWNGIWAMGHLAVLATMGNLSPFNRIFERDPEWTPSWLLSRECVTGVTIRGAWAAARFGKRCLPGYKRLLARENHPDLVYDTALAMIGIAARHSKLRAEVEKAFDVVPPSADDHSLPAIRARIMMLFGKLAEIVGGKPEVATAMAARTGRAMLGLDVDGEKPPNDIACAVATHAAADPFASEAIIDVAAATIWAARAKAEELYVPSASLNDVLPPWDPELCVRVITRFRRLNQPAPVVAGPRVGRNDPCPCGSGKKWKRCCQNGASPSSCPVSLVRD